MFIAVGCSRSLRQIFAQQAFRGSGIAGHVLA